MKDTIERKLDILISILETMPKRLCDELDKRNQLQERLRKNQLEANMDMYRKNIEGLNDMRINDFTNRPR